MTKNIGKKILKIIIKSFLLRLENAIFNTPYLTEDLAVAEMFKELLSIKKRNYCTKHNIIPISKKLGLELSYACNLACECCSNFSNYNFKGNLTLDKAEEWMSLWNKRISPMQFHLVGGEPTINPQLSDIIRLTREKWKYSEIHLVTNGFFLHRHPDLPKVLREIGNAILVISIHHDSDAYMKKIAPNLALAKKWKKEFGLNVIIRQSTKEWVRMYKGHGSTMEPFEDNDPKASWKSCLYDKDCTQLLDGNLWKCPPLAYLPMVDKKFHLSEKWSKYLSYQPLSPDCTKEELIAFIREKEIPECSMCAAKWEYFEPSNPLIRPSRFSER